MIAIIDKRPVLTSLDLALDCFIKHRQSVILRRSQYWCLKKQERKHILEGLIKVVSILDEVINLIRESKDRQDAINRLIDTYAFSFKQAEAIVMLRLYRLTNTDITELKKEYANLSKEIFDLENIINNPTLLLNLMITELKNIKDKFKIERRTKIEHEIEDISVDKLTLINNDKYIVSLSKDGYIKKVSLRSFNSSEGIGGIKEGDNLIGYKEVENLNYLLIFTNLGNYICLPVYEISEFKWKDIGKHLNSYIKMKEAEKIVDVIVTRNFDSYAFIVLITKNGLVKKSLLSSFKVNRYNKAYTAIKFRVDDEVVCASIAYDNNLALVVSGNGYSVNFEINTLNIAGLKSSGAKAINLEQDDTVSGMNIYDPTQVKNLLVFTKSGLSKRIKLEDIKICNKGVKGLRLSKYIKTNPQYIKYVKTLNNFDEVEIFDQQLNKYTSYDFTLMTLDSSYSSNPKFSADYWMVKNIQDVIHVEYPKDFNDQEYNEIGIFDNVE